MGRCRGKCDLPDSGFLSPQRRTRYAAGFKFCRECNKRIKWEGRYCPCCSNMMRDKARYVVPAHAESQRY